MDKEIKEKIISFIRAEEEKLIELKKEIELKGEEERTVREDKALREACEYIEEMEYFISHPLRFLGEYRYIDSDYKVKVT